MNQIKNPPRDLFDFDSTLFIHKNLENFLFCLCPLDDKPLSGSSTLVFLVPGQYFGGRVWNGGCLPTRPTSHVRGLYKIQLACHLAYFSFLRSVHRGTPKKPSSLYSFNFLLQLLNFICCHWQIWFAMTVFCSFSIIIA